MKKLLAHTGVVALLVAAGLAGATYAHAETSEAKPAMPAMPMIGLEMLGRNHEEVMKFLGVYAGKVTTVSGTTLTITDMKGATYTVNAGSASVMRNNETSSVSSIVVGDGLIIRGSLSDTTITAEKIVAASMPGKKEKVVGAVKKIMREGFKDMRQGMKYREGAPAQSSQ